MLDALRRAPADVHHRRDHGVQRPAQRPGFTKDHFASFTSVYSGGAAISPTAREGVPGRRPGNQVHNAYGLTETTSPMTVTPFGAPSPVDPTSGALSVGVPVAEHRSSASRTTTARTSPLGEIGEIVADGPQVVAGYWGKPEETADNLPGGALKSGDVGLHEPRGLGVHRRPQEGHDQRVGLQGVAARGRGRARRAPGVREAAVVGVPDEKRGETVKAFVSLKPGATVTPDELIAHCKERMAAYKYPRQVDIVDELPKTVTGKILRRELRD